MISYKSPRTDKYNLKTSLLQYMNLIVKNILNICCCCLVLFCFLFFIIYNVEYH